jgi:hypothetical protein
MLGRLKHLAIMGSATLSLGMAMLVVLPQQPQASVLRIAHGSRARPWIAQPCAPILGLSLEPSQDLYELAAWPMFGVYYQ